MKAAHVAELRARLNEARAAIGLPSLSLTDGILMADSTLIRAVHVTELRDGVKCLWRHTRDEAPLLVC